MIDIADKIKDNFLSFSSSEHINEVIAMGELIQLEENEIFIRKGERQNKVALVLQGLIRQFIINSKGQEVTVLLAAEMRAFAPYKTLFLNQPSSETSMAIEPSIVFVIDFQKFKTKSLNDKNLMLIYLEIFETCLVSAIKRIEDFTQLNPEQRYRRLLIEEPYLIDRTPLKYLASYLGITPVSLSRIRKRISAENG